MLEATPGQPYGENTENLLDVEANMILRRKCIQKFLQPGEQLYTMSCFPRMGTPGFTQPWHPPTPYSDSGASLSSYIPDEVRRPWNQTTAFATVLPSSHNGRSRAARDAAARAGNQPAPALPDADGQHPQAPRRAHPHRRAGLPRRRHRRLPPPPGRSRPVPSEPDTQ